MTVNATSSIYQGSSSLLTGHETKTEEKKDPLGREAFLTMLVAQLQHQDPLNPMEGTDFTSQLAQFSSLEQQFTTNDALEAIRNALEVKDGENLIDYIGKNVEGSTNTLVLQNGSVSGGSYSLEGDAEVVIAIYDSDGIQVRSLYGGQKEPGTYQVNWDGKDNSGSDIFDGTYSYEVIAVNDQGGVVSTTTSIEGLVNGVIAKDGKQYLQLDDRLLDPTTVTRVWMNPEVENGNDNTE
jgi:flagellar hook assembly protein FlgD